MYKKRILVSIPNTGWIHKIVAMRVMALLQDNRYMVNVIMPTWNPIENNLHKIIVDFIKEDFNYWLNIDSDNPPTKNPLDLVDLDLDIITCPTPVYHFNKRTHRKGESPVYLNAYKYLPDKDAYTEWPHKYGLQKVDAVGNGCTLYAKRVFLNKEMQKGAFTRKLHPDGTVNKGNDISMSERARAQGFSIYAHYDYICQHFNEVELGEFVTAIKGWN